MRSRGPVHPPSLSRLAAAANGWPRQAVAGLLLLCGAALLVVQPAKSSAAVADVLVAARPLTAGELLVADDLRVAQWPTELVPVGALRQPNTALGKPVAGPVSTGEALTAGRMLNTAISSALRPGQVAVSVVLRDATQTAILQAGARVDLYVARQAGSSDPDPPTNAGTPIASDVQILAVLTPSVAGQSAFGQSASNQPSGNTSSLVIACPQTTAAELARGSSETFVASLRPSE